MRVNLRNLIELHCPACRSQIDAMEIRKSGSGLFARTYAFCPACHSGLGPSPAQRWFTIIWTSMLVAHMFFLDVGDWPIPAKLAWGTLFFVSIGATALLPQYAVTHTPPREELEQIPLTRAGPSGKWVLLGFVGALFAMAMLSLLLA